MTAEKLLPAVLGLVLDATFVIGAIVGTSVLVGTWDIRVLAIAVSVAGVPLAVRRMMWRGTTVPAGLRLWGLHGTGSVFGFVVLCADEWLLDLDSQAWFGIIVLTFAAVLLAQAVLALFGLYRCVMGDARTPADLLGTAVCVLYAFVIGYWLLYVWE